MGSEVRVLSGTLYLMNDQIEKANKSKRGVLVASLLTTILLILLNVAVQFKSIILAIINVIILLVISILILVYVIKSFKNHSIIIRGDIIKNSFWVYVIGIFYLLAALAIFLIMSYILYIVLGGKPF
jgi:hypothetical protein